MPKCSQSARRVTELKDCDAKMSGILNVLAAVLIFLAKESPASSLPPRKDDSFYVKAKSLPGLIIHTNILGLAKSERLSTSVSFEDDQACMSRKELIQISPRGSSSRFHAKKSFRLEFQDPNGNDKKVALAGMPKESDWILYASYTDKTLIRNALAQDLWRAMGRYAVRSEFVELIARTNDITSREGGVPPTPIICDLGSGATVPFLNTNEYQGVYLLMEKIKRSKYRVAIEKLDGSEVSEPDITGGYIFKHDRLAKGEVGFKTQRAVSFQFEEPKEREITSTQRNWLTNHIQEFERVLFSTNFSNSVEGYRKYIEVESFIDYHWIVETTRCMDGFNLSQFYYKDRNGKIKMGPIWDWDLSFGNAIYAKGYETNGWRWTQMTKGTDYLWFARLFEDISFLQRYVDRWSELRTNVFATSNIWTRIDAYADRLTNSGAIDRNYKRWPTMGLWVYPAKHVGRTYQEEIGWLKNWIKGRLEWIDSQDFPKPMIQVQSRYEIGTRASPDTNSTDSVEFSPTTGSQPSTSSIVQLAWLVGTPYYTLDGTDPRVGGGGLSRKAIRYTGPFQVKPGDKLFVRSRGDADPSQTTNQKSPAQNDPRLWSAPQLLSF